MPGARLHQVRDTGAARLPPILSRYPDIRDEIAALATQRREMNRQLLNEAA
jgi:hypothetical protein